MSDTPISDSTPHNVADLGMQIRWIERKLNAANAEVDRLTEKVAHLYEGSEEQKQRIKRLEGELTDAKNKHAVLVADVALYEDRAERIKRLEDYGNALVAHVYAYRTQRQWTEESYHDLIQTIADWDKAKANKP